MSSRKSRKRGTEWSPVNLKAPYHSCEFEDRARHRTLSGWVEKLRGCPYDRAIFTIDAMDERGRRDRYGEPLEVRNLAVGVAHNVNTAKRDAERAVRAIIRGKPRLKK